MPEGTVEEQVVEEKTEPCPATSPDGEPCKYLLGHDATGEPHSWTMFGFGGPGA